MAATGAQVLHFDGAAYIDYMIDQGYITADQSNPSYGGAPTEWVAQAATSSSRASPPTRCTSTRTRSTGKTGHPPTSSTSRSRILGVDNYAATMAIRADRLEEFTPCLEVLVPSDAAGLDRLPRRSDPDDGRPDRHQRHVRRRTGRSAKASTRPAAVLEDEGMAANSPDGTYCTFDEAKVAGAVRHARSRSSRAEGVDDRRRSDGRLHQQVLRGSAGR